MYKFRSIMLFMLILVMVSGGLGCTSLGMKVDNTSVCDKVTEENPSYFCEIANKYEVSLNAVGQLLSVTNVIAISQNVYTAKEALRVLKDAKAALENPVSYIFVQEKFKEIAKTYPEFIVIIAEYTDELNSTKIMYTYDRELLNTWLDERIAQMEFLVTLYESQE